MLADFLRPAEMQFPSTARPQQEFHDAVHIAESIGIRVRADHCFEAGNKTAFALQSQHQFHGIAGSFNGFDITPVEQNRRHETRVEGSFDGWLDG